MNNNKFIEKFLLCCVSEGIKEKRIKKYRYELGIISKKLKKNFDKVTKDDLIKLVADIHNSNYSPHTKHDYKVAIKKFYKFLGKEKLVFWVKTTVKKSDLPLPQIATRDETIKLLQGCRTVRDKALISLLFESGCRIGELLNMKIANVEFDSYGCVLMVDRGGYNVVISLFDCCMVL